MNNVDYDLCVYDIGKDDVGQKASISMEMEVLGLKKLSMNVKLNGGSKYMIIMICVLIAEIAKRCGLSLTQTFAYIARKFLEILEKHIESEMIESSEQDE